MRSGIIENRLSIPSVLLWIYVFLLIIIIIINRSSFVEADENNIVNQSAVVSVKCNFISSGMCYCHSTPALRIKCAKEITKLKITNQKIRTILATTFHNLTTLEYIDLSGNNIEALPNDVFAQNKNLKWINLSRNKCESLPNGFLANRSKLEGVHIIENGVSSLPEDLFHESKNLKVLNMSSNALTKLPEAIFHNLQKLERLGLSQNSLVSLSEKQFVNTTNLLELDLSTNRLENIPERIFRNQNRLQILNLHNNCLTSLPNGTFSQLKSLTELYLSHNRLRDIPEIIFWDLQHLQILSLWKNQLKILCEQQFINLTEIIHLDLHENQLDAMPMRIFQSQSQLKIVKLRENHLKRLPNDLFVNASELMFIGLEHNQLDTLPHGIFRNQRKLEYAYLTNNSFTELSGDLFNNATNLMGIHLSKNQLRAISPAFIRNQVNLEFIALDGNSLTTLPRNLFDHSTKLNYINLWNNRLHEIPTEIFDRLEDLDTINLGGNFLTSISENQFVNARKLRFLAMTRNKLQAIPVGLLRNAQNLNVLYLNNNSLTSLPTDLLQSSTELRKIDISNNHLQAIPDDMFKNQNELLELHLDGNKLNCIHANALKNALKLRKLNLKNNELESIEFLRPLDAVRSLEPFDGSFLDLSLNHFQNFEWKLMTGLFLRFASMDLSNNHLQRIHFGTEEIESLQNQWKYKLILNNNPMICDCQLAYTIKKLSSFITFDIDDLECKNRHEIHVHYAFQMRIDDMFCPIDHEAKCRFFVRKRDGFLKIDCSDIGLKEPLNIPQIPKDILNSFKISKCYLNIENNQLRVLPDLKLPKFNWITAIKAGNNAIGSIEINNLSEKLTFLDVNNNRMTHLNENVKDFLHQHSGIKLLLKGNNWICDCSFHKFVRMNSNRIDYLNITCDDGKLLHTKSDWCPMEKFFVAILILLAFLIGFSIAFYYKYENEIKVWLYARGLFPALTNDTNYDSSKMYDAFISYSHHDEDFVFDKLMPELEQGPIPFKVCIHTRDWLCGDYIPDQISRSVECSRRTIVVLSQNFLKSVWCRMEIRAAHRTALAEGRVRLILIIYDDIGHIDQMDADLKVYLWTNTYLKWGERWFFDKLRYSLPHPPRDEQNTNAVSNRMIVSDKNG